MTARKHTAGAANPSLPEVYATGRHIVPWSREQTGFRE